MATGYLAFHGDHEPSGAACAVQQAGRTMIAWVPALRTALKVAPIALEVARQVDRQVRPRLLAYRHARAVDGYVATWSAGSGTHWLVFPERDAMPLRAFPPLAAAEVAAAGDQLDRGLLRHHTDLPEARARDMAVGVRDAPLRAVAHLRDRLDRDEPAGPAG